MENILNNMSYNKYTPTEEIDNLYRLNVRSASAWDKNKENSIILNKNWKSIVKKLL